MALCEGSYGLVLVREDLLVFARIGERETMIVALNFGGRDVASRPFVGEGRVVVSTRADRDGAVIHGDVRLGPHEGLVIRLGPEATVG